MKTFLVADDGLVYRNDLGPDTAKFVSKMDRCDPDKSWKVVR